jgi:hypothetical protein
MAMEGTDAREEADVVVPLKMGEQTVYLTVSRSVHELAGPGQESEIAAHEPRLEQVLDGLAEFGKEVIARLRTTEATKVTVEYGCDIALESGTFFALIGKASARSTLKVGLEWTKPTP